MKQSVQLPGRSFWGFLCLTAVLLAWLAKPETVSQAAQAGLGLCAHVVIPSLFPFFVLCNLFVRRQYHRYVTTALRPVMGPLFGQSADAAGALALGVVGGYPVGAATAFQLYDHGALDARGAARLLAFCNNAGPGFVFGVVGASLLGSARAGAALYGIHLLSALLVGMAAHALGGGAAPAGSSKALEAPREAFAVSFVDAVKDAAVTMLQVSAFLVFFAVLLAFLRAAPFWRALTGLACRLPSGGAAAEGLLQGVWELSSGIHSLSAAEGAALPVCCSLLLGWGGLCVHCQTLALRGRRPIPMRPYFLGKAAQAALSALLTFLFFQKPLLAALSIPLAAGALALLAQKTKQPTGKTATDGV